MAVNDRFNLQIQGVFCGAQFSWNFVYQQIQPDQPGINPGLSLVNAWTAATLGPWRAVRLYISSELKIVCANWSSGENVGSAALTGANSMGEDSLNAPLPPTVAILIHEWATAPHDKNFAGRFYLCGLTVAVVDGPGLIHAMNGAMAPFLASLVTIGPDLQPNMFRMVPSEDFVANGIVTSGASVFVGHCFHDPLLRRINSRLPDHCAIVAAQGAPVGMPGVDIAALG